MSYISMMCKSSLHITSVPAVETVICINSFGYKLILVKLFYTKIVSLAINCYDILTLCDLTSLQQEDPWGEQR